MGFDRIAMSRFHLASLVFALVAAVAAGCAHSHSPQDSQQAIRAALEQHLAEQSNLNLSAMDMNIEKVDVNGNHAQAQVQFRLRQSSVTMEMLYDLEQHGGTWIVTHSQPAGGQFAHPPMDKAHSVPTN